MASGSMPRPCSYKSNPTPHTCAALKLVLYWDFLGTPELINGPIFCTSKIISCVVTSAAEAELGATFQNAQKGAQFRNPLTELGYPQRATPILVDNMVAEGLATDTINAKRSKSMDVRFSWLRDRIQNSQFFIRHIKGKWNISNFFTKPLPKDKFEQFSPYDRDRS